MKGNYQELQQFLKTGCDKIVGQEDSMVRWINSKMQIHNLSLKLIK
ncbi:MAG: hypothetical protein Q8764_00435 [Pigeon pea little leaf phytoplasma]|nr:hypothetical protein [Pigeon pea little leaf phytoplasma]